MIKHAISSKGKFASMLYHRNSMIDPKKAQRNSTLARSSLIISKSFARSKTSNNDLIFMVDPKNVCSDDDTNSENKINPATEKDLEKQSNESFKPKSSLTPFLLLIALSLHGFFEGVALGIQSELNGVLFLAAAILSHKWAEAFTLVNFGLFSLRNFYNFYYFSFLIIFINYLGSFL